jgi:hypothetical protein
MMIARVNLLRPDEMRYQGPVSREFIRQAAVGGVCALLLLMVVLSVFRHRSIRHNLVLLQESWSEMSPRYEQVRSMQAALGSLQQVEAELQAWNASRIEWGTLLTDLQQIVPAEIQLTRLSVRGETGLLETPASTGSPKAGAPPPLLARRFNFRIDGRAPGAMAEEVVVRFARTMRDTPAFKEVLDTVRLQGLQRAAGSREEPDRLFGIEGTSRPRVMQ